MATSRRKGDLARLAQRVIGQPLMIDPRKAEVIIGVLGPRLGLDVPGVQVDVDAGEESGGEPHTEGGVAVIPIHGTLVQRAAWLDAMSGLTSYQAIRGWFDAALADPAVQAIVLDIDSGGGEVSGCFDLVDYIAASRGKKTIVAVANEAAFSAAYAIASAADQIWLPRTAGVGSVGVIALHCDESGADKMAGRKVTAIYAGDRKNDFSQHEPLSREARAVLQAEVDRVYGIFAGTVARNRSLSVDQVMALEAGLRFGDLALEAGLADAVGTLEEVVADLAARGPKFNQLKEAAMAKKTNAAAPQPGAEAGGKKPEEQVEGMPPEKDKPAGAASGDGNGGGEGGDAGEENPDGTGTQQPEPMEAAAAITEACVAAGVPGVAATYMRQGLTIEQVKQRLGHADRIRRVVAAANRLCKAIPLSRADAFIQAGTPLEAVHAALWDDVLAADAKAPEISSHREEKRQPAAGASSWDKATAPYQQKK